MTVVECEVVWLKRMLKDLIVPIKDPNLIYCDNMSSIHLAQKYTTVFHTHTKHIEVHYHFIRESIKAGDVDLQHISINLQTVDIFTKSQGANKLRQFMLDLGLKILDLPNLRGSTWSKRTPDNTSRSELRIMEVEADTSRSGLWVTQVQADFGYSPKPTQLELEGAC